MATATLRTPRGQLGVAVGFSLVMSVLLITASAAFATTTGSATGTGIESNFVPGDDFGMGQPHPHCLEVTDSEYTVALSGTFNIGTSPQKTYSGPATMIWQTDATYYIDESGTYTTADHDHGCDLGTLGDPIAASVTTLDGSTDGTHSIDCANPGTADYSRINGMTITVHYTGSCTVQEGSGGGNIQTDTINATFTGLLHPCDGITCDPSFITNGTFSY